MWKYLGRLCLITGPAPVLLDKDSKVSCNNLHSLCARTRPLHFALHAENVGFLQAGLGSLRLGTMSITVKAARSAEKPQLFDAVIILLTPSLSEPAQCLGQVFQKSGRCLHRKKNEAILARRSQASREA